MATTQAQEQQLSEFLAVMGDAIDPGMARAVLESADWNLEVALNHFLEGAVPSSPMGTESSLEDVPDDAEQEEEKKALSKLSVRELRSLLDALEVDHSTCLEKAELIDLVTTAMLTGGITKHQSASERRVRTPFQPPRRTGCQAAGDDRARLDAQRREEIAMQDAEFQESLLIDQQRETLRKEAEEEERRLQETQSQLAHDEHVKLEAKRARVSHPEPDRAHPDRCQIVIRTPSGKRLSRAFLGSDDASLLYDWIDVACDGEAFTKSAYLLVSRLPGQPAQELPKSLLTLMELGVQNQTVLFITALE